MDRIAGPNASLYQLKEPVLSVDPDVFLGLDRKHFYELPSHARNKLQSDLNGEVLRQGESVKVISLFSDLTVVHNTRRLDELDPSGLMRTNPTATLDRLHGRAFALIDGNRTVEAVLQKLANEFGPLAEVSKLLPFLGDLEALEFLKGSGRIAARYGDASKGERDWDLNLRRVQSQLVYSELPLYVLLELTYDCNLNCRDCYTHAFEKEDSLEGEAFLETVINPIIESGVSFVAILGGEPFEKKPLLLDVVRRLRDADVYAKLITNGLLVDEESARQLDEGGLNKVEVSVDGFAPVTNDRNRGSGSFDGIVRAIGLLRRTNIPEIGLSVTVNSDNFAEVVGGLPGFVLKHGVQKVYFSRHFDGAIGGWREMEPEQEVHLAEKCLEWNDSLAREIPRFEAVILGRECTCARSSVVVTPTGDLKACPFVSLEDERLSPERSLRDIWENSPSFWKIREAPRDSCAARNLRDRGTVA